MINEAKWITLAALPDMMPRDIKKLNGSIYLRKSFELCDIPLRAELQVCGLGIGVYTINGLPVTDEVLCTPFTCYDKRVIYSKFDVTKLLNEGGNAIGIYVGNGFYNDNMTLWNDYMAAWKDNPKAIAALEITYKSGECIKIMTDCTWKCAPGPSVYNHMRQGEMFDARLKQDGFDTFGFDDWQWENAKLAHEPGGIMETTAMPPIRVKEVLKPVSVKNGVYDFGKNISGWAHIRVNGARGEKIRLIYDENLNEDGLPKGACTCYAKEEGMPLCNEDVFICSGRENEEFRPSFAYHGFRYVKVEGAAKNFEIEAEFVHTDLLSVGSFECSDDMLNKIHNASTLATLSNYMGIPTDCPHREQNGWTGDAQLSSEQVLMNFDAKEAYAKWMRDFKDAQRPNGQLPGIIPSAGWGYNWGCGPSFDSAIIIIPLNVYINTGDSKMISEMWDNMVLYMEYFSRMCQDGIAEFGLGDWNCVKEPSLPLAVTDTAYYYYDCEAMAYMADLIGKDSQPWSGRAKEARDIWRSSFWGNAELENFQTFFACAIYQGLLNADEIPCAAKKLAELVIKNGCHIDCGMLGTKYIFSALSENGYMDLVYKMVTNPSFPSYAYWINSGQTALCEDWDMKQSCNHHIFSEVDNWFYKYVGGIKYTRKGLVIEPLPLKAVRHVKAEHNGVSVTRDENKVSISLPKPARIIIEGKEYSVQAGNYEYDFEQEQTKG